MKSPGTHAGHKHRARQRAEQRTRSHQTPVVRTPHPPVEFTLCSGCGAVYSHKTWRRTSERIAQALAAEMPSGLCPACRRGAKTEAPGRVLLSGNSVSLLDEELRRRILHVGRRAASTQPQRRIIDIAQVFGGLEVRTTSQELAHRIARELQKAFGGQTVYTWSDNDGHLLARWQAPSVRPD